VRFLVLLIGLAVSVGVMGGPLIDNNAGSWTDLYNDNLGVSAVNQTVVDSAAGVVRLVSGQSSGDYTTVRIKPSSFDGWGEVRLDGVWSGAGDVRVEILDSLNGDVSVFGPVDYSGPVSLAGLSASSYPELKVRVYLTAGVVRPAVTSLQVSWNAVSGLLIDKQAPAEVLAGQQIVYRVRYSVSHVTARGLVVWDQLPHTGLGTMTYAADYGQDDNVEFVWASGGGQYTGTDIEVGGVMVPGGSVYWDLGDKLAGTTETLTVTVKTKNGTLDGSWVANRAWADAANAAPVSSGTVNTVIRSVPGPYVRKDGGEGIFKLPDASYTVPGGVNQFLIRARNNPAGEGRETMYGTVVYDDLSDLVGKVEANFGGLGVPVAEISGGGVYDAAYNPPSGGGPFPAVVWNVGVLAPGQVFEGSFKVRLLGVPPLGETGQYVNRVCIDSERTRQPVRSLTPLCGELLVKWMPDKIDSGSFAKGDNLDAVFEINGDKDDDRLFDDDRPAGPSNPFLYVNPGGVVPYGLMCWNSSLVALNDVVYLDKVPTNTVFRSAWFSDPWLQANGKIFYSTTETGDWNTPPDYDYSSAPGDLDPAGQNNWEDYWLNPPVDPAGVKWVAFWLPAVNSRWMNQTTPGWVAGAPQRAVGYFDVVVSPSILDADPCAGARITNRALFWAYNKTPMAGGSKVPIDPPLAAIDDEPTLVGFDQPNLFSALGGGGGVTPLVVSSPGELSYVVSVENNGRALAPNVELEIRWPRAMINGVEQYLPFVGVSPAAVGEFDPNNGRLVLSLGNLAPGKSVAARLTVNAPAGLENGQQLTFVSRASASPVCESVVPAVSQASAVVSFQPKLRVLKNDVLDLIPSGGYLDYRLTLYNTGTAPSHGTFVVDRVPAETVFVSASGPDGERVWFSSEDNLPPSFLTAGQPIDRGVIAARFTPGVVDDNGTPADPSDDVWTSPFGDQTRWVAWEMDLPGLVPAMYPVGQISTVGFRVKNDLDGPGPGTAGSAEGTQIFNVAGVFSDELLQAIGNEVVSTIKEAPGILVQKSGPEVVSAGETFVWTVTYYNNSAISDDVVTVVDRLPAGVSFVSARHIWNGVALANGAPVDNNGQLVPSSVVANGDGTTTVTFNIAGAAGYRGNGSDLESLEGGTIELTVQVDEGVRSNSELLNLVRGCAQRDAEEVCSSDQDLVIVRNAELEVVKLASPRDPVSGEIVTYSLVVRNVGELAARDVVVRDRLPAGVTFVSGSAMVLTAGYSAGQPVVEGTGPTELRWSVGDGNALTRAPLAPGTIPGRSGDIVIQYQVRVNAGVPAGTELPNTVCVETSTPEDDLTNNCDDEFVRTPNPDPALAKRGPVLVGTGERFTWTIEYWNNTRQSAANVYVIDTLPDYSGDGEADVTFVSQTGSGPGPVTAYYHGGPSGVVPVFDPTNPTAPGNGWSATPTVPVNHIAWLIGTLPGQGGPYALTVTVDAIRPNHGSPELLPAGVVMVNVGTVYTTDTDEEPSNNTDDATTRTPGNDVALSKEGSSEGAFPGLIPGSALTYTITVANSGTQVAYGLEVVDTLPVGLTLNDPVDNFGQLSLIDGAGNPVRPVDVSGNPISVPVPVSREVSGREVRWYFGTRTESDPLYYRKIGVLPGSRQSFEVYTTVSNDVGNGVRLDNVATVVMHNRDDGEPPEEYLGNNTDGSWTTVYLPDLAVRKSVRDVSSGSEEWTEAGRVLEYRIEYNNLGYAPAYDSVISEVVPEGTRLLSVNAPVGGTVTYHPGPGIAGATSFDVNLGTVSAPANVAGVPLNLCFSANSVVELSDGKNGIPSGSFLAYDNVGNSVAGIGDVDGDGVPDVVLGALLNDDGAQNAGGAWVILLNADGTAKSAIELANGKNGIPSGSFAANDYVGYSLASAGDVDGDGVPDVLLSAHHNSDDGASYAGGAWVILLNADGTAKSAIELANGKNGIPSGSFAENDVVGGSVASIGDVDGDGVPDVVLGAQSNDDGANNAGGAWVILLNADGTAKSAIELANGKNGIPSGSFLAYDNVGYSVAGIGDVDGDGVPDLVLGAYYNDDGAYDAGGAWVILLNRNGTAKSAIELANGKNGIPSGSFAESDAVGGSVASIGDVDGDGVPDVVLGAYYNDDGATDAGGAWVILLNADGTAKSAIELANGKNGIPSGSFAASDYVGQSVGSAGDVDGDGVPDVVLSASHNDDGATDAGGAWVILLNTNGTAKSAIELANDKNGFPAGSLYLNGKAFSGFTVVGDVNGDRLPDMVFGHASMNSAYVVMFQSGMCDGRSPCASLLDGQNVVAGRLGFERAPGRRVRSAIELANGKNGIPSGSFAASDYVGRRVASAGDVDGDGVPDLVLGAYANDDGGSNAGGAWVILLNADGTAKSAVELANGKNGVTLHEILRIKGLFFSGCFEMESRLVSN